MIEFKFEDIFDNSAIGMFVLDFDGKLLKINPIFKNHINLHSNSLIYLKDIIHVDDLKQFSDYFNAIIEGFIEFYQFEIRLTCQKKGGFILTNMTLSLIRDSSNKPLYLLGIADNITEKKELEKKQKAQEHLLIQQSKLASIGEMIASISHQWRQPLNSLSILIQDVLDAYDYKELDRKYLQETITKAMRQIDFMNKTMDDFKNFFLPNKTKEYFSIYEAIIEIEQLLDVQLKQKGIDVLFLNKDSNIKIFGNKNEFKQVILNILNNAKDAIVANSIKKGLIKVDIQDSVDVTISDNGGGIKSEVIEKIFEPYFSTKGEQGSGIGLYMSLMIIEDSFKGKIGVKNIDDGAEFKIHIPA